MEIAVIGLGRMGNAIAFRLLKAGYTVYGFDIDQKSREEAQSLGVILVDKLNEISSHANIIWFMIPSGHVDNALLELLPTLKEKSIVVDGGNSYFVDSIARAQLVEKRKSYYLDVGTSGGLHGREHGFSLMVGGSQEAYNKLENIFKALAAPQGYGYLGPSGSGHYVKMIHNGIEYALLQAYAEGFDLLKHGRYKDLDLEKIADIWIHGSVIRSWILELTHKIYEENPDFKNISGKIGGGQTGRWTVQEAHAYKISVKLIEESLAIRDESQKTGGDYATKLVALLRNQFGGHAVEYINEDN